MRSNGIEPYCQHIDEKKSFPSGDLKCFRFSINFHRQFEDFSFLQLHDRGPLYNNKRELNLIVKVKLKPTLIPLVEKNERERSFFCSLPFFPPQLKKCILAFYHI